MRAGIALKPGTDATPYLDLLPEFDQVLIMTVEPGFGGEVPAERIASLRDAASAHTHAHR